MSTMGMQVELSMTAKGLDATLKGAQGQVVETAAVIRSQLGTGAAQAGQGIFKLKEGLGRARETAMYFTQSLGEFGPTGRTAQMALSSLGSMMLGGGLLGAGLAAAQAAVRLLTASWEEEAAASKKAADEAQRAGDAIRKASAAARDARAALDLKAAGGTGAMEFMRSGVLPARAQLAAAKAAEEAAQADLAAWTQNIQSGDFAMRTVAPTIEAARQEVARTSAQVAMLQGQLSDLTSQAEGLVNQEVKEANKPKTAEEIAADEKKKSDARQAATNAYMANLNAILKAEEEAANERGRTMLAEQQAEANRVQFAIDAARRIQDQWVAAGQSISSALGDLGNIIGGAAKSWMGYFAQLIQKAIQLSIAMSGTAGPLGWLNAAAAAVAMISAVSAVPEFRAAGGPVSAGQPYIVGERGPELFVPGTGGSIAPNGSFGGGAINITLNATDARSVRRLLLDNGPALAEAIGKAARDGRSFS